MLYPQNGDRVSVASLHLVCTNIKLPCSCRRPARSSPTSLVIITSTACSTIPAHNRRSTHISSRCIHRSSATHCRLTSNHPRLCPSSVNVLKHSFSPVSSQHSSVTLLRLRGLRNSSAIVATLKISDWHLTDDAWQLVGQETPECDIFNLGSSYFYVPLTTVRHLLNAQRHVTAFRPISEAAHSWSYYNDI